MSDNKTAAKPKVQRLSPNARAQLISEYNAGKELSNPEREESSDQQAESCDQQAEDS